MLAHDEERAWLLLGDAGQRLGFAVGPEPWLSILRRYAELQRGEAAHATAHLVAGAPDRRLARVPALYDAMLPRELPLGGGDLAHLRAFTPPLRVLDAIPEEERPQFRPDLPALLEHCVATTH